MTQDHRKTSTQIAQEVLLDDAGFLKEVLERVFQEWLEAEMTEHVGAAPYERAAGRKGHRNGHKPRSLRTRVGTLNLLVPQDREGTFSTRLFSRYQRNEKALCLALMEMYVEGVSTRKVKDVTEALCGTSFSKSTVSHLAAELDAQLGAWRSRPLEADAYPYVFVDARYEKVRVDHRIVSQGVLVVSGVRAPDGLREILGVEVADTESEATYHELFRSLKARGLRGVELVVSDGHEGLKAAVSRHFQGTSCDRLPLHSPQKPARDGERQEAQGARGGLAGDLRPGEQGAGPRARLLGGREVAGEGQRAGRRAPGRTRRRVLKLPGVPRKPPQAHPHDQRPRETQPGDKAPNAGCEDLPQPGLVRAASDGVGGRAIGGVGNGEALSGHGGVARASMLGGVRRAV
jgi:putative transposase